MRDFSARIVTLLRAPLDDTLESVGRLAELRAPTSALVRMMVGMGVAWFAYVPVHELLHAAGCALTGGTVSELQIDPLYGGALLARVFPFVVAGGEYAGRLSGFDTGGSDAVYLATVFAPYTLSILFGVPLLRLCATRPLPLGVGASAVLALAPFYNLPGDYYELGSILATRAAGPEFHGLRSDDLVRVVGDLATRPQALGVGGAVAAAAGIVVAGAALGILLALLSYAAGRGIAALLPLRRA
jgi:hypothetical protein